MTSNKQQLINL